MCREGPELKQTQAPALTEDTQNTEKVSLNLQDASIEGLSSGRNTAHAHDNMKQVQNSSEAPKTQKRTSRRALADRTLELSNAVVGQQRKHHKVWAIILNNSLCIYTIIQDVVVTEQEELRPWFVNSQSLVIQTWVAHVPGTGRAGRVVF